MEAKLVIVELSRVIWSSSSTDLFWTTRSEYFFFDLLRVIRLSFSTDLNADLQDHSNVMIMISWQCGFLSGFLSVLYINARLFQLATIRGYNFVGLLRLRPLIITLPLIWLLVVRVRAHFFIVLLVFNNFCLSISTFGKAYNFAQANFKIFQRGFGFL